MGKDAMKLFNGSYYRMFTGYLYPKKEAQSKATQLRKEGWLVRVVREGSGISEKGAKKIPIYRLYTKARYSR
ncbi:MAG: hypothetical protein PHW65_03635 [Dehalococcoidales bacterium]|nr:hypothetical protein [Dehalococcoidales bacterium]